MICDSGFWKVYQAGQEKILVREDFLIDIASKSNIIYINAEINFTIFRNRKYNSDISFSYSVKIKRNSFHFFQINIRIFFQKYSFKCFDQ